jgi:hypothetical protein
VLLYSLSTTVQARECSCQCTGYAASPDMCRNPGVTRSMTTQVRLSALSLVAGNCLSGGHCRRLVPNVLSRLVIGSAKLIIIAAQQWQDRNLRSTASLRGPCAGKL